MEETIQHTSAEQVVATESAPKWYIDESIAGTGDRPEWIPEKYKTVKDAVLGGTEAVKMYTKAFGAPEGGYKLDFEAPESPLLNILKDTAKNKNLSNDMFNSFINDFVNNEKIYLEKQNLEIENTKKTIGAERIDSINNFIANLKLPEGNANIIKNSLFTDIKNFEAIESLKKSIDEKLSSMQPSISNVKADTEDPRESLKKLYESKSYRLNPGHYASRVTELADSIIKAGL